MFVSLWRFQEEKKERRKDLVCPVDGGGWGALPPQRGRVQRGVSFWTYTHTHTHSEWIMVQQKKKIARVLFSFECMSNSSSSPKKKKKKPV